MSAYRDILWAVHSRDCRERIIMAFDVRGYFDESQDKYEKVHAMGGFIGTADQWEHLQDKWIARVKPTGVKAFHFADCEEPGHGEFSNKRGWKSEDRKQLIKDVIQLISSHEVLMLGCGIILDDYKKIRNAQLGKDRWHFALQAVLLEAALQTVSLPPAETIAFFFDWRDKRGFAKEVFAEFQNDTRLGKWRKRLGTVTFGHKEFDVAGSIPLLQVADVAAFEIRKVIANPITHPHLGERKSLLKLKEAKRTGPVLIYEGKTLQKIWKLKLKELGGKT
jgi:hypothetical protein